MTLLQKLLVSCKRLTSSYVVQGHLKVVITDSREGSGQPAILSRRMGSQLPHLSAGCDLARGATPHVTQHPKQSWNVDAEIAWDARHMRWQHASDVILAWISSPRIRRALNPPAGSMGHPAFLQRPSMHSSNKRHASTLRRHFSTMRRAAPKRMRKGQAKVPRQVHWPLTMQQPSPSEHAALAAAATAAGGASGAETAAGGRRADKAKRRAKRRRERIVNAKR